jgi:hypothetical protein
VFQPSRHQPVQEVANDDRQLTQSAELASKPADARLSWRKEPIASREATNSANYPTDNLQDWKGTYHHERHPSFGLA